MAAEFAKPLNDVGGFVGIGVRIGQIMLVVGDGLVRLVFAPGDFSQAKVNLERVGERQLQGLVIGPCGIQLAAVEIGDGAIKKRVVVVGLDRQNAAQGVDGVGVRFDLN